MGGLGGEVFEELRGRLRLLAELRRNIASSGDPLGLPDDFYRLEISGGGGEYLLFTGREYVIAAVMAEVVSYLLRGGGVLARIGVAMQRLGLDVVRLVAGRSKLFERMKRIPAMLAEVLRAAGLDVCYAPEADVYPGSILWEMGLSDDFRRLASSVAGRLRPYEGKTIVATSPHSAEVLSQVYPGVTGLRLRVVHYAKLLAEKDFRPAKRLRGRFAYHDPCRLARDLGLVEEPRVLLQAAVEELVDHPCSGRMTTCCGAPAEAILPRLAREAARYRLEELKSLGVDAVVVACPFCLASLSSASSKGDPRVVDLVEVLWEAAGGDM